VKNPTENLLSKENSRKKRKIESEEKVVKGIIK
jgi:hypothetical protein